MCRNEEYEGGGGVEVATAVMACGIGVFESSRGGSAGGPCGSGC
jgi:hypothetical protein